MLSFPVRIARTAEGKVRVIFLDVPEAVAEAVTEEEALFQARFALEHSLGHYLLHGRSIPVPSDPAGSPTVSTEKFSLDRDSSPEPGGVPAGEHQPAPGGGRY